jgi:hypothetical protein
MIFQPRLFFLAVNNRRLFNSLPNKQICEVVMLVPDRSLSFIEADSQDIMALYRSSSAVAVNEGDFAAQLCDAFICAVQEGDSFNVYMILMDKKNKKTLVYTLKERPKGEGDYGEEMQKALGFAEKMGFTVERVNLDYSKALKEVIISDTRVFRAPGTPGSNTQGKNMSGTAEKKTHGDKKNNAETNHPGAKEEKTAAEKRGAKSHREVKTDVENPGVEGVSDAEADLSKAGLEKTSADTAASGELSSLKAKPIRLATVKIDAEKTAAKELDVARAELERLTAAKTAADSAAAEELAVIRGEAEKLVLERNAAEKTVADELASARAELEKLKEEKTATDTALSDELSSIKAEMESLISWKADSAKAVAKEIAGARAELERLTAAKTAADSAAAEELAVIRGEAEKLVLERNAAEKTVADELASARAELERLKKEKAATDTALSDELFSIKAEMESLISVKNDSAKAVAKEIAGARAELESLTAEKSVAEAAAAEEIATVRAKLESLATEKKDAEKSHSGELASAEAELERMIAEKNAAEAAAAEEISSILAEIQRLTEEKAVAEKKAYANLSYAKAEVERLLAGICTIEGAITGTLSAIKTEAEGLLPRVTLVEKAMNGVLTAEKLADKQASIAESDVGGYPEEDQAPLEKPVANKVEAERSTVRKAATVGIERNDDADEALIEAHKEIDEALDSVFSDYVKVGNTQFPLGTQEEYLGSAMEFHTGSSMTSVAGQETVAKKTADQEAVEALDAVFSDSVEIEKSEFPLCAEEGSPGSVTEFHIDSSMTSVEFAAIEDIMGIYQSLNVARVNTKGNTAHNAKAYICGLKRDGIPSVYIALQLIDKNQILMYVPERQPVNSGDYEKTVRDAVDFVETAGFLMDSVALKGTEANRAKALSQIPVLRQMC